MTDKEQVIIDGIDVSECNFLGEEGICNSDSYFCEGHTYCYFKQLARKTQECEKFRKANDEKNEFLQKLGIYTQSEFKRIKFYISKLKQECEELKERKLKLELNENHNKNEIKKLKKRIRKDREFFKNKISSLTLARKEFLEALDHFNWQIGLVKNDRYRKALEEIEEVTKYLKKDLCGHCSWYGTDNCNPSGMVCEELIKILDIINKVKGEGNE